MARENLHATVLGPVVAVVIFVVLLCFVGVDEPIDRVTMAKSTYLIAIFIIAPV